MDFNSMIALGAPIGLGIAAIGSAFGIGRAVGSAMEAMGNRLYHRLPITSSPPTARAVPR